MIFLKRRLRKLKKADCIFLGEMRKCMTAPNPELSALSTKIGNGKSSYKIRLVQLLVPVVKLFVKLLQKQKRVSILMKMD